MIEKLKNINWPVLIFTIVIAFITAYIAVSCLNTYKEHKAQRIQAVAVAQAKADEVASVKEATHQASITRLVSICMTVQEQFDKLTVKDKVGKVRPDCTVVE